MLDSTENHSELMDSTKLGQNSRVDMKSGSDGKVLLCLPQDNNPFIWDALPPADFVQKHGGVPLTHEDLEHILILVKDQNGNYAPSTLFDKTITNADGTKPDYAVRKGIAEKTLRDLGIPLNFDPERVSHGTFKKDGKVYNRYKLEGERQFFETAGGLRMHQNEYRNSMTTAASAPDVLLHNGYAGILVFRHEEDGLHSISAFKLHYGYEKAQLKSTANFYHDTDYIDSRSEEWNTSDHRFKGYLHEGHTKNLSNVLVSVGGGRMFSAEDVLTGLPNSPQANKLRRGPTPENEHILINVKDIYNNTHVPIELVSVNFPGYLSKVVHEIGMHKGAWAETTIDSSGSKDLTPAALNKMFHKYRNAPDVMVQSIGVLFPLDDPYVTATGQHFMAEYPPDKIFVATVGKAGGRNGSYRNVASFTIDRLPSAAAQALRERIDEPQTLSRFAPQRDGYPTPAATPSDSSSFADSQVLPVPGPGFNGGVRGQAMESNNTTVQEYRASSGREDIINRPVRSNSVSSMVE